jgi:hypothetical protein
MIAIISSGRNGLYLLLLDEGNIIIECTEKTTREEWRGPVYVGVRIPPVPPHIPVLFSRLPFFSGVINR